MWRKLHTLAMQGLDRYLRNDIRNEVILITTLSHYLHRPSTNFLFSCIYIYIYFEKDHVRSSTTLCTSLEPVIVRFLPSYTK